MNDLLRALLDLPPQASTFARGVDMLHYFVIGATMLGATFVFAPGACYFLVRYRRRAPGRAHAAHATPRLPPEASIIGGLLTLFLVFWIVGADPVRPR